MEPSVPKNSAAEPSDDLPVGEEVKRDKIL